MPLEQRFEQHSLSWADLFALMKKYRWVILTVFVAVTIGAWTTLQVFFTDEYETKANILVKIGRENAEIPSSIQNGNVMTTGVRLQDVNSEVQMLSSRAQIEAVVDQFGPAAFKSVLKQPDSVWGYPKYYLKMTARFVKGQYKEFLIAVNIKKRLTLREEAVLVLENGIKVEPIKESDVLTLKLRLPSATLAVDCANSLLQHYLTTRSNIRRTAAGSEFFDATLKQDEAKLGELRDDRDRVRSKYGISSAVEQRTNLLKEYASLREKIDNTDATIRRLERQREAVAVAANKGDDLLQKEQVTAQNPSIQSIKERLTTLELERAKISGRYSLDSEVIAKADKEIAALRQLLEKESPTILSRVTSEANPLKRDMAKDLENHDVQLAGLRSERAQLEIPLHRIEAELAQLNVGGDAFEAAEREYRLAEQFYMLHVRKMEEAKLTDALDQRRIANVSIIAPPDQPIEPAYPPKPFVMAIALPVGLLLGIALSALLESMEDRILSSKDLESIEGLEFMGTFDLPAEAAMAQAGTGE
jgi:polysaccharide biosynthesis protein PslE